MFIYFIYFFSSLFRRGYKNIICGLLWSLCVWWVCNISWWRERIPWEGHDLGGMTNFWKFVFNNEKWVLKFLRNIYLEIIKGDFSLVIEQENFKKRVKFKGERESSLFPLILLKFSLFMLFWLKKGRNYYQSKIPLVNYHIKYFAYFLYIFKLFFLLEKSQLPKFLIPHHFLEIIF